MARARKSETREMRDAAQKIAGMKAINENLDLDNDVSVANMEADLGESRAALDKYNQSLAVVDANLNALNAANKKLRGSNKRVLPAVALKYGMDSNEYEKVGGVRESERKKSGRRKKTPKNEEEE